MTKSIATRPNPWLRLRADGRLVRCAARVTVRHGPDAGAQAVTGVGPLVIGTHPSADLRLSDDTVSSRHASVEASEDAIVVIDLGSKNGTRLHGALIGEARLSEQTELVLGTTVVTIAPADVEVTLSDGRSAAFAELVGDSEPMRKARALLERVAATSTPVLLVGPSGTGKDTAAQCLHRASGRSVFVTVDGAISPSTAESELFGHARGAFTGASGDREGLLAAADGGTLYLDEPSDLPRELQTRLLRFLETRAVRAVGGDRERVVDVRVVTALRRDPGELERAGELRKDLRHRLEVVRVDLPALSERPEDVPAIVRALLEREGRPDALPGDAVMAELARAPWPGNVRELRNVLQRALLLEGGFPESEQIGAPVVAGATYEMQWKDARNRVLAAFEREYIERLLDRCGGNVSRAADEAGVQRSYMHRRIRALGVRRPGS